MSDSNDDLEGGQLVVLLVFFCTIAGGLYLLGWLTRPSFLWNHPLACAAIAGATCYPARFLVERSTWWKRLGDGRVLRRRRREPAAAKGRRRGWSLVVRAVRVLIGVPLCLGSLAILPLSVWEGHKYENLVKNGLVQQAVVVSVERVKWAKYDEVTVKVARPGDGKPIELDGGYNLDPAPQKGDRIAVVVDPGDPDTIISATVDWSTPWWSYPLILLATAVLLVFGVAIAFA